MSEVRSVNSGKSSRSEPADASGFAKVVRLALELLLVVFLGVTASGMAEAQSPNDLSFCGGDNQRGCCITEAFGGGCDTGVTEFIGCDPAQVGSCSCGGGINATTTCLIPPHPQNVPTCGGPGQRACCSVTGEANGPCDNGLTEITGCSGPDCTCGGANPADLSATSSCVQPTSCGGANQRACCIGEANYICQSGLAEVAGCGPDGSCTCSNGLTATSSCYPVTPCGGSGQRACCALESSSACDAGLVEVGGCSGDCTCEAGGVSFGTCTPATGFNIPEPGVDAVPDPNPRVCSLDGYMDMHLHLGGHLAHGGGVLGGKYYDPVGGVNGALAADYGTYDDLVSKDDTELPSINCPADAPNCGTKPLHLNHLVGEDSLGSELATKDGATSPGFVSGGYMGAPSFGGWPKYTTTNHQQAYYKWLERAWLGGLRLTTMLAVSNTSLCEVSNRLRNTDCSDIMSTIDLQLDDAWAFEAWLDTQSGGPGQGWFRIVETPAEARAVMAEGKLAVVLGIEVDHLFNCSFPEAACTKTDGHIDSCDPNLMQSVCTTAQVDQKIDEYDAKGVRHVFPIHNFDNSFGGAATWQDGIEAGNRVTEGHWWKTRDCGNEGYSFSLTGISQALLTALKFDIPASDLAAYVTYRGLQANAADCNEFGLFPLGEHLINRLMDRGMIIDVDHMSSYAFDDTLDIAEARNYAGIVSSHVQFLELNTQEVLGPLNVPLVEGNTHERMRTDGQLSRIRDVGGMIATMAKDDVIDSGRRGQSFNLDYGEANDTCLHSSRVFAQMYQYSVDQMAGPVAIGSDFNGIAGHLAPRFGSNACGGPGDIGSDQRSEEARFSQPLNYPFSIPGFGTFNKQTTGLKTYDYNFDGLAHIGLFPDMIADMIAVGLDENDLEPLFHGAQAYVDMWDKAAGTYAPPPQAACTDITVAADGSCQASNVSIAGFPADDPRIAVDQLPGTTFPLGTTYAQLQVIDACDTETATFCDANVTVVDQTPPQITCPANVTAECTGATTSVALAAPTTSDNCTASPSASCPTGSYALGATAVQCSASDGVGNQSSCSTSVSVVDTTPPTALCQSNVLVDLDPVTGSAVIAENLIDAGSSDVCTGTVTVDTNLTSFSCADVGTQSLSLTVTDGNGLSSSCTGSVIVRDVTSPVVACQNATVTIGMNGIASITTADINAGASDACLQQLSLTQTNYTCADAGSNLVQMWATDVSGNTTGCSANVEVLKRPTTITLLDGVGQFSDVEPLRAILTDTATGTGLPNSGLRFSIGAAVEFANTDANGVATLPASLTTIENLQGSTVTVSVVETCNFLATSASATIGLAPEDAAVSFDPANPQSIGVASPGANSGPFSMTAYVRELTPDVAILGTPMPGNLQFAYASMQLEPVVPGPTQYGSCMWIGGVSGPITGTSYDEVREMRCDFDNVPEGDYNGVVYVFGMFDGGGETPISVPEPSGLTGLLLGIGMLAARGRRIVASGAGISHRPS